MRKIASRLIVAGLTATALTFGLTASVVTTASAAVASRPAAATLAGPTCHGTSPSCIGHDPATYGCVISATKESANSFGTVWEQFSNNCDAKWAWGQLTPRSIQNGYKFETAIGTSDNTQYMCAPGPRDTGSFFEYCTGYDTGSAVATTDMVDGHKPATAFVYVFNANGVGVDELTATITN